jgi:uncharacterized repeat protein (TIGR02543 family)
MPVLAGDELFGLLGALSMISTRRLVTTVALALVLSAFGIAEAGVNAFWKELGGSASGGGISKLSGNVSARSASVVFGADNLPIVGYGVGLSNPDDPSAVTVKRFSGGVYQDFSPAATGFDPRLAIAPNGTLFVSWLQDDGAGLQVHLLQRTASGTSWTTLGPSEMVTTLNSSVFSHALAVGSDNVPVVAIDTLAQTERFPLDEGVLQGTHQIYVLKFNGTSWDFLGGDPTTGGASNASSLIVDGTNYATHHADSPSLTVVNNQPTVAFRYLTDYSSGSGPTPIEFIPGNTEIFATKFNANTSSWVALGPAVPQSDDGGAARGGLGGISSRAGDSQVPSIAGRDGGAVPPLWLTWLEFTDGAPADFSVLALQFNGSAWVPVAPGSDLLSDPLFQNHDPQVAVTPSGQAVVAWSAFNGTTAQIFVKRSGALGFEEMGTDSADGPGISDSPFAAIFPSAASPNSGGPGVAWLTNPAGDDGFQVYLRQFSTAGAFKLTVNRTGAGANASSVTSSPAGIDCPSDTCSEFFPSGQTVLLTAVAGSHAKFGAWTGCNSVTGSVCSVLMNANKTVSVSFLAANTVSVQRNGNGAGRVTAAGIDCGPATTDCSEVYTAGVNVTLTATVPTGTVFGGWGDACAFRNMNLSCPLGVITGDKFVTVNSTLQFYTVKVNVTTPAGAPGQGTVTDINDDISCDTGTVGICTEQEQFGSQVALRAFPAPGSRFLNYTGTICNGSTNSSCNFTVSQNQTVTALFRAVTDLFVNRSGNGAARLGNRVTFAGNGLTGSSIDCGAGPTQTDCTGQAFTNSSVVFMATLATGSNLDPNGGACTWTGSGLTRTCSFVASGFNQSVNATFSLIPYTLTVASRPGGNVATVDALPDPIDCGAGGVDKCSATLNYGTLVRLQATPILGSKFTSWTGCTSVVGTNCSFTLTANRTVTPAYRDVTSVSLTKTGQGTITSSPAGISCGPTCTSSNFDFARNTLVKLTPAPVTGWDFIGWSGDPSCPGTGPCSFNASTATPVLVAANFSIQLKTLRVTVIGNGSVTGPGFACDPDTTPCAQLFPYGTIETLAPAAAPGFKFTGWSQDCSGTSPTTCKPTMTANHSVTATFKQVFGVTVTRQGNSAASGAITAPGVSCGLDCAEDYLSGTTVTFSRSAPPTGRTFRWLGDCAFRGTNNSCTLTIDANKSVIGDYSLQQLGLRLNVTGPGTVTGLAEGDCTTLNCLSIVDYGVPVLLQATPSSSPQGEFISWTGCTTTAGTNCSVTLTANRTVAAQFRPVVTSLEVKSAGADATVPLAKGALRQYSAIATFSDSSTQDVTTKAMWTSANKLVVTVTPTSGLVTGVGFGNTSITAVYTSPGGSMQAGSLAVAVDTVAPTGITVDCSPYGQPGGSLSCLPAGRGFEVECRATASFTHGGAPADVTDQATWSSSSGSIARFFGLSNFGEAVVASFRIFTGNASIRATVGGASNTSAVVQGTPLAVTDVSVAPTSVDAATVGTPVQLTATATLAPTTGTAPGCTAPPARDFSLLTTWRTVPDPSPVADVSVVGLVTPLAPGTVPVHWSYAETLRYTFSTSTTPPPGPGGIRFNSANVSQVTHLYVHETDRASIGVSTTLDKIAPGSQITVFQESNNAKSATFTVTAALDAGTYRDYTVTPVSGVVLANGANSGLVITFRGDVPITVP